MNKKRLLGKTEITAQPKFYFDDFHYGYQLFISLKLQGKKQINNNQSIIKNNNSYSYFDNFSCKREQMLTGCVQYINYKSLKLQCKNISKVLQAETSIQM